MRKWLKWTLIVLAALPVLLAGYWLIAQLLIDHDDCTFTPGYERVALTEETDADTVFLQTGLSPVAAETVLAEQGVEGLQYYQDAFFGPKEMACTPMFGLFIREDRQISPIPPIMADLQPGDILMTLSTHSAGWRHGHAALVVREDRVLQLAVIGTRSALYEAEGWLDYSQYVVLRLKDMTPELQAELVTFMNENLKDVPYSLLSGILGAKVPDEDEELRLMCTSLVWYAYYQLGYDLDSDGGRIISTRDMLESPYLEVVQVYGMDPRAFTDRIAQP